MYKEGAAFRDDEEERKKMATAARPLTSFDRMRKIVSLRKGGSDDTS